MVDRLIRKLSFFFFFYLRLLHNWLRPRRLPRCWVWSGRHTLCLSLCADPSGPHLNTLRAPNVFSRGVMITLFHGAVVRRAAPIIEAPPALRAVCAQLGRHAVPSRAPLWFDDAASVALLHVRLGPWLRVFTEEALPWPDGLYRCEAALALSEPLLFTPASAGTPCFLAPHARAGAACIVSLRLSRIAPLRGLLSCES